MVVRTWIVPCEKATYREYNGSETVLFYKLPIGRLGLFIRPDAMPPFEGKRGFVETLGPATRVKVLRQVEEGTKGREATAEERRAIYSYRRRV